MRPAVSEKQLKLGVFAKNATADTMGGVVSLSCLPVNALPSPPSIFGPWLSHERLAAAAELDGKEIPAGSFVNLKEGQEIVFEDGSRYTVRVDGKVHQQSSTLFSFVWAMHDGHTPAVCFQAQCDHACIAICPLGRQRPSPGLVLHHGQLSPDVGSSLNFACGTEFEGPFC